MLGSSFVLNTALAVAKAVSTTGAAAAAQAAEEGAVEEARGRVQKEDNEVILR